MRLWNLVAFVASLLLVVMASNLLAMASNLVASGYKSHVSVNVHLIRESNPQTNGCWSMFLLPGGL